MKNEPHKLIRRCDKVSLKCERELDVANFMEIRQMHFLMMAVSEQIMQTIAPLHELNQLTHPLYFNS